MEREYIYHSFTRTLCNVCGEICDGKIIYNNSGVYILKHCEKHGEFKELLEELPSWHLKKPMYDKPATISPTQTEISRGCPFDCGLCPNHDQHTCIGLIEITSRCNLGCPLCYAKSGCDGTDLSLETIKKMMDFYMTTEGGAAEILQISGGEPTLHPDCIEIIRMAKKIGFKYVMLNTNGLKIAEDKAFAEALAEFRGGFELYLQFDGLRDNIYRNLRGRDLLDIKIKALENLAAYKIPTTLVMTVDKNNAENIGETLVYAMQTPYVRGVNFQPVAYYGNQSAPKDRITLSGVIKRIEEQTNSLLRIDDFIPLPCNTERVALTYLLKDKKDVFTPITRDRDLSEFKNYIGSTFMFTVEDVIANFKQDSSIFNLGNCCDLMVDIKKYLPLNFLLKSKEEKLRFVDENTFRISISSFIDKYNFDTKSAQKECVHIIIPELKRMPFSAYNLIYRVNKNG